MRDAYHSTLRKCDILLTTRLEDSSHDCAIRPEFTHSFKDVLVVGELKANLNKDMSKETILQLARLSVQYSVHNQEVDECIAILKSTRGRGI